jgi:hypothetical protein
MLGTFTRSVAAIAALGAALAACGGDGTSGAGAGTTSAGGNGGSTTTSAGGGTTTTNAGGNGGSTTTSEGAGGAGGSTTTSEGGGGEGGTTTTTTKPVTKLTYCTRPCGTVTDCCPAGLPDCPSDQYPTNYLCTLGVCYVPECSSTADCAALDPAYDCFDLAGFHACGKACAGDVDCGAPQQCTGADSDGKKFCELPGGGCQDDASCGGLGKCVDHKCICESDADCTKPGFTKCAL